jgi:hypothetical protein
VGEKDGGQLSPRPAPAGRGQEGVR